MPVPPTRADLAALPAHVVARDFPEAVAAFRRRGVDLPRLGGSPVRAAAADEADALLDEVEALIAWRGAAEEGSRSR